MARTDPTHRSLASLATRARTWLLLAGLSALLIVIGASLGGGWIVAFAAAAALLNLAGYWFSDRMALRLSRARPLPQAEAPGLHAAVGELAARAGVPMPRLYLIPSRQPNAFATGRNPSHSAIAVTEPGEQVRGVLAHELAHIRNRDVLVSTIAAMLAAAVSLIASVLQLSWLFGGDDEESPLGLIGMLATVLIAPIAAMLLQLAVSRQREYLADATGAELLGRAAPLADALGTLERGVHELPMPVMPATASLYIASPLQGAGGLAALFSTHPPMAERIRRLRALDATT